MEKKELNLNIKINSSLPKNGIFDYSSNDYIFYNKKIEDRKYFFKNEYNIIKFYDSHGDKENGENLIFKAGKKENKSEENKLEENKLKENKFQLNIIHLSEKNFIENIDKYFWYVINSDSNNIGNTNDDYYISENDIIKIGKFKYIVREIKIKNNLQKNNYYFKNIEISQDLEGNNEEKMKKQLSSLNPPSLDFKKCEDCGCLLIKFCKCDQFDHFKCIKNWIKGKLNKKNIENIGNTFRYYHFNNIDRCEECNTYNVPLKFKLNIKEPFQRKLNFNDKELLNYKIGSDIPLYFKKIKKPNNCDYLILESIEYEENSCIKKSIHIIKLTGEDIKIGQDTKNDIVVDDSSVCKVHAIIKYDNGKLLLKNLSKKAGTLVFIPKFKINISEKKVLLQIDNISLEAQVIRKKDSNEEEGNK